MNYAAQQWTADAFFEVMDKVNGAKIFVPCGYSALYDPAYTEYFERLPDILNAYDATVYLSDDYRDINFAREHGVNNTKLIPNGADENEFANLLTHEEKTMFKNRYGVGGLVLVTVGNYTGEKGHKELLEVFRKLPVSKATLLSIGTLKPHDGYFDEFERQAWGINQSRKHIGKRVVMIDGTDRATVLQALKSADIFVFLSNIEASPLVMFEAAAAGLPFIATAAGNNREIASWIKSGVIVKTRERPNGRVAADMKDTLWQLTRLAHSREKQRHLGQVGREIVQKKYTWDKLTDEYIRLYESVLKKGKK